MNQILASATNAWVEQRVTKVWEEIKEEIIADLKLNQEPVLVFHREMERDAQSSLMYIRRMTKYVRKSLLRTVIVETSTDYIIHVNTEIMVRKLLDNFKITLNLTSIDHLIRFLLLHENRHLWQAQSGFYNGQDGDEIQKSLSEMIRGHGSLPEEEDANYYAVMRARTDNENFLFCLEKALQEESQFVCHHDLKVNTYINEVRKSYGYQQNINKIRISTGTALSMASVLFLYTFLKNKGGK